MIRLFCYLIQIEMSFNPVIYSPFFIFNTNHDCNLQHVNNVLLLWLSVVYITCISLDHNFFINGLASYSS
ncbi:MAG: hypothetical protein EXX96DRAFT_556400 [Benjaminiella poitrasii]|nr:MAG: hypothetical protein EXX96DRAFT_556400 [Benjaminiella poitrasii]